MLDQFAAPDGRTLVSAKTFREQLGGISAVTEWRRRRNDPDFPEPVEVHGRHFYYKDEADKYISTRLIRRKAAAA